MELKQKQHAVVDVTGNGSKVQCCKEQYCTGNWNVRAMNQSKLESLRRNGVAIIVNKRAQNKVIGCNLENGRMVVSKANHSISQ